MKELVQPNCPKINYVDKEKMQSKNKRKATSLDNISTSCVLGNSHVDNDIAFNIV